MYDSYEDSTRGPPHGPSRVHLKKKGMLYNFSSYTNWCNAPLDMPARGGLMLVLPYNLPLHVCKDDSAVAAASLLWSSSSWVMGAGAGFPFGLQKL